MFELLILRFAIQIEKYESDEQDNSSIGNHCNSEHLFSNVCPSGEKDRRT